jgi:hypothetical protein
MILQAKFDKGVPVPKRGAVPRPDDWERGDLFIQHMNAAANTAEFLEHFGVDLTPSEDDHMIANTLLVAYAADPVGTVQKGSGVHAMSDMTPPQLKLARKILTDFGHAVVEDAAQLRHLVTNKLIEETENPDPRIRVKALELLGKVSDVGLFSEKSEVTITHRTDDDLRATLRDKLSRMKDITPRAEEIENAEVLPELESKKNVNLDSSESHVTQEHVTVSDGEEEDININNLTDEEITTLAAEMDSELFSKE